MNGNLQSRIERNRDGNEIEMKRNEMNPNELETPMAMASHFSESSPPTLIIFKWTDRIES